MQDPNKPVEGVGVDKTVIQPKQTKVVPRIKLNRKQRRKADAQLRKRKKFSK